MTRLVVLIIPTIRILITTTGPGCHSFVGIHDARENVGTLTLSVAPRLFVALHRLEIRVTTIGLAQRTTSWVFKPAIHGPSPTFRDMVVVIIPKLTIMITTNLRVSGPVRCLARSLR